MWESKVLTAAGGDVEEDAAVETNWKLKVTPDWGDLMTIPDGTDGGQSNKSHNSTRNIRKITTTKQSTRELFAYVWDIHHILLIHCGLVRS